MPFNYVRICIRCHQPTQGHSWHTFYGSLRFIEKGFEKKINACGEPLHYHCPDPAREQLLRAFDDAERPRRTPRRARYETVAPGIRFNPTSGNYLVSADGAQRRHLGSRPSFEAALELQSSQTVQLKEENKHEVD